MTLTTSSATASPSQESLGAERSGTQLALLERLEASLAASQAALLRLDLAEVERGAGEQRALGRQLAVFYDALRPDRNPSAGQHTPDQFKGKVALRLAQARVRHL